MELFNVQGLRYREDNDSVDLEGSAFPRHPDGLIARVPVPSVTCCLEFPVPSGSGPVGSGFLGSIGASQPASWLLDGPRLDTGRLRGGG